jgi:hypothetical protein
MDSISEALFQLANNELLAATHCAFVFFGRFWPFVWQCYRTSDALLVNFKLFWFRWDVRGHDRYDRPWD